MAARATGLAAAAGAAGLLAGLVGGFFAGTVSAAGGTDAAGPVADGAASSGGTARSDTQTVPPPRVTVPDAPDAPFSSDQRMDRADRGDGRRDEAGGSVTLYGPDGEFECAEDCLDDLTEGVLSERLDADQFSYVYGAMEAIIARIGADRGARRRFLNALGGLDLGENGYGDEYDQTLIALATYYDLPSDFAGEIAGRMNASADPQVRSLALNVISMSDDPAATAAAVEGALIREREGPALINALDYVGSLQDGLSPSGAATVEGMARRHADPDVRRAALGAMLWSGARGRDRVMEAALADEAPSVRLAAVSGIMYMNRSGEPGVGELTETATNRYRAMTEAIANDADAPPEARMEALSMLAYGEFSDDEDAYDDRYGHY